jgi:diguanylate cyclase (GGDEF)-like protein/PAS domain S-box-containing protein
MPSAGIAKDGKTEMIQVADKENMFRVNAPKFRANAPEASDRATAIEPSLLTLRPTFQAAIHESIATGAAVEVKPEDLPLPKGDRPLRQFCDLALSGCPVSMELSLLSGRRIYVSLNWVVNETAALVAVRATDVTEEKQREEAENAQRCQREIDRMIEHSEAERQLRDSEERYRASFEQAAVGILHTSFDGRILRCNRQFGQMLGYAPEELVGHPFQEITPPGDQPPSRAVFDRMISGELPTASFEKRYVRKGGQLTWVNLTITTQRDSDRRPQHFITMVQDIDARKRAEQQLAIAQDSLRRSEERYRTAFQMTMDAVALNRVEDGTYVDCNLAFQNMTMYTREEVLGRSSIELGIWTDTRDRVQMIDTVNSGRVCRNMEAQFRKKNGDIFWGMMSASIMEVDGEPCVLTVTRDMSDAKMAENEIKRLAYYDPLTGLPNRRMFLERLQRALTFDRRNGRKRALLFVDVDNFKTLNDTLGHHIGDLLLQEVARRITSCIRETDTPARIGGDEFVLMLESLSESQEEAASQAKQVAEKILTRIAEPYALSGRESISTSSIGITVFGNGNENGTQILQQAEIAMYQAKAAGRNAIRFFAPALQAAVSARACLEDEIRHGIREHQFALWYQPQVDRGSIVGAEALLRWNHPRRGLLGPGEFIPLAEDTGLIVPLGRMVLEQACRQAAVWAAWPGCASIPIAVNVSARQFRQPDFVSHVLETIESTGATPKNLKLEITESMLLDNLEETVTIMQTLREHGLQFSLDDFGTGYSSLAYLKRLPLDQLKIDRSFVRDILVNATNGALAQAIISLARALGLLVIAEGVETDDQRMLLSNLGCDCYQGFLFSKAIPAADFEALLNQRT